MHIKDIILKQVRKNKEIKVADIVKGTGFSRAYINKFMRELTQEGKIVKVGKANRTKYVLATKTNLRKAKKKINTANLKLKNKNLSEDIVLDKIKRDTGIFINLAKNIEKILNYSFSEILNNAIEHSKSSIIKINIKKNPNIVSFWIIDKGVGIFNHIMKTKGLKNINEAISELTKGKLTTLPSSHSGEGIFFTSKLASTMCIQNANKKILFNNLIDEIFVSEVNKTKGTKVNFTIFTEAKTQIEDVFKKYTSRGYKFDKTKVVVKLFNLDQEFFSRSEARRITANLEKFDLVILDFKGVKNIGQGFSDQIFRVWQNENAKTKIITKNANQDVNFMIKHIKNQK